MHFCTRFFYFAKRDAKKVGHSCSMRNVIFFHILSLSSRAYTLVHMQNRETACNK